MIGRALEDHVLEQVRHARLAVAFLPRADQHGHVHGHFGLRVVGKEQHAQAVVELVFGDAFDRGDFLRRFRRQRNRGGREQAQNERESGCGHSGRLARRMADASTFCEARRTEAYLISVLETDAGELPLLHQWRRGLGRGGARLSSSKTRYWRCSFLKSPSPGPLPAPSSRGEGDAEQEQCQDAAAGQQRALLCRHLILTECTELSEFFGRKFC